MENNNTILPDLDELLADLDDYVPSAISASHDDDDEDAELAEWEKGYWLDVCGGLV